MIFAWIEERKTQWPIAVMCGVLEVSRSGFYAWRSRRTSATRRRRNELTIEVKAIHAESDQRYGSPRIHRVLRSRGHECDVKTVAKVMKEAGISAKTPKRFVQTTDSDHSLPVAANRLDRDFTAAEPNRKWVSDITYIRTQEGWVYLAVVIDLFSRMVVGWSMDATMTSRLVVDALTMALRQRVVTDGILLHSDRGCQYASEHYRRHLCEAGIECSMSRKGNCWDNAPTESFFATLKKELVHRRDYATREAARQSVFEYVEVFYNRVRLHSSLGYVSPAEYEQAYNRTHR